MKILFIGGVKSGKSKLAEEYLLSHFSKPFYLATTELFDDEMISRIQCHKMQRKDFFETIEEPLNLLNVLTKCNRPVLVECVTMWLNNALFHQKTEAEILSELTAVMALPNDLVLVQNEIGMGVIPDNVLARQFVDLSGKASQIMAQACDNVFFCSAGLALKMK